MTWKWIKSHTLHSLTVMIIFFAAYQSYLLLNSNNKLYDSLFLAVIVFCTVFISGFSFFYKNMKNYQKRLEDFSTFIAILSRGNLKARLDTEQDQEIDEIGKCSEELNELAEKVESSVQSLQRLVEKNAELADKAHQLATEDERQRLARELHDAVSQQLFALNMMTSACLRVIEQDVPLAKKQMTEIAEMAGQAQAEMRALLLHLRPTHLTKDSLHDGIYKLLEELKSKCNIKFIANIEEIKSLSHGIENHIFRIVQEALSNTLRHADATEVKVSLNEKDNDLRLLISDNGKGFNIGKEKLVSYGLKTMKERCEELGGTLSLQSKEGEGTYLQVKIPLQVRSENVGEN
jgi:two-component system, NarL family, sensor histidine kinase LiaS